MVLRDSHVASLLGMTNLGHCANELMPQIMPACKAVTDRRYRRNCFNAAQYGSAVRCRARHASPRLVKKVPSGLFSPSCFPNCKIKFCSMILQFCRCGGGSNAKGHPDGFLSHFPSLRNFRLSRFFDSLAPTMVCPKIQKIPLHAQGDLLLSYREPSRATNSVSRTNTAATHFVRRESFASSVPALPLPR